MVNPIASGMHYSPQTPMAADFERPPATPEAAVVVTPTTDVRSNGNATTGSDKGSGSPDTPNNNESPTEKALNLVNNSMEAWSTGMRFDMDEEAQRLVVSITDSETGEVIRTVPSDAVIRVAKMIVQLQGANIDTKA
ncbi:flagellar protein FlaG [Alcaligenaceae bacterium]|nr:flagellar protein FlaG [Alcaligenaceae bacterium]